MYSDKKKRTRLWIVLALLLLAAALALVLATNRGRAGDMLDEGAVAIRALIEKTARQCYAVEGVYPPDLAYLEEHYGIRVNHNDYYVTYDAFASNLPPEVRVTAKRAS